MQLACSRRLRCIYYCSAAFDTSGPLKVCDSRVLSVRLAWWWWWWLMFASAQLYTLRSETAVSVCMCLCMRMNVCMSVCLVKIRRNCSIFQCECTCQNMSVMYMSVRIDWHAVLFAKPTKPIFEKFSKSGPYPIFSRICIRYCVFISDIDVPRSWACTALEIQAETVMHTSMHMFKRMRFSDSRFASECNSPLLCMHGPIAHAMRTIHRTFETRTRAGNSLCMRACAGV